MMNMTLAITLEAFNQKHGEFYLQLTSLAKQYGINISTGSSAPTTPIVSAPTTSASTVKPDYTSHLKLTLEDGYIKLPIRKKFVMIKAAKALQSMGCSVTDTYGYYIPSAEGTIDIEATKALFDSIPNNTLEVK